MQRGYFRRSPFGALAFFPELLRLWWSTFFHQTTVHRPQTWHIKRSKNGLSWMPGLFPIFIRSGFCCYHRAFTAISIKSPIISILWKLSNFMLAYHSHLEANYPAINWVLCTYYHSCRQLLCIKLYNGVSISATSQKSFLLSFFLLLVYYIYRCL